MGKVTKSCLVCATPRSGSTLLCALLAGTATYHGGAIGHLVAQLSEQDGAWRAWFAANGIRPLTIAYEDLAVDAEAATAAVLDHLGVGPVAIPAPPLRRQGDDRSARWAARFRSEAAVQRV